MKTNTTICMVRHGQTDWNKNELIQGLTDNLLNEIGIRQAHEAGKKISTQTWDVIVSSPLKRAYHTAQIIASHINYLDDIHLLESLVERDFGDADGRPVCDYYDLVMQEKVSNMELNTTLISRVKDGLDEITATFPNKKILVICHSHIIKAALIYISKNEFDFTLKLDNTSLNYISFENDVYKLVNYNVNGHMLSLH
ncbi:MAG: histidine phosphatase family protein [Turicibacter sp.]